MPLHLIPVGRWAMCRMSIPFAVMVLAYSQSHRCSKEHEVGSFPSSPFFWLNRGRSVRSCEMYSSINSKVDLPFFSLRSVHCVTVSDVRWTSLQWIWVLYLPGQVTHDVRTGRPERLRQNLFLFLVPHKSSFWNMIFRFWNPRKGRVWYTEDSSCFFPSQGWLLDQSEIILFKMIRSDPQFPADFLQWANSMKVMNPVMRNRTNLLGTIAVFLPPASWEKMNFYVSIYNDYKNRLSN